MSHFLQIHKLSSVLHDFEAVDFIFYYVRPQSLKKKTKKNFTVTVCVFFTNLQSSYFLLLFSILRLQHLPLPYKCNTSLRRVKQKILRRKKKIVLLTQNIRMITSSKVWSTFDIVLWILLLHPILFQNALFCPFWVGCDKWWKIRNFLQLLSLFLSFCT